MVVNSVCPGWVRTDMGGASAPRSIEQGAASVVWGVMIPTTGPPGGSFATANRCRGERGHRHLLPDRHRTCPAPQRAGALCTRGDGGPPRSDRGREPGRERHRDAPPELAVERARGRRGGGPRRGARAAARAADRAQGPGRRRAASARPSARRSIAIIVPDADDAHRRARCARAGAILDRQDQHAGVRRRLADLQRGLRRHAQSVRPRRRRAAAAAAARPWRSRAACCRSPTAAISAARCATRRASATSSASARRPGACRAGRPNAWATLSVARPDGAHGRAMRRSCCRAMAGPDPRVADRRSREPGARLRGAARRATSSGVRVAWSRDLGGAFPSSPRSRAVVDARAHGVRGARLHRSKTASPDFSGADETSSRRCAR